MRLSRTLLLPVLLTSACAGNRGSSTSAPELQQGETSKVESVTIAYGIGYWGIGATYSFEIKRDGQALYIGEIRAVFAGSYEARADTAVVRQLLERAGQPNRLKPQAGHCSDVPTRSIVVRYAGGKDATFGVECGPDEGTRRFATELDKFFAELAWCPSKRAT